MKWFVGTILGCKCGKKCRYRVVDEGVEECVIRQFVRSSGEAVEGGRQMVRAEAKKGWHCFDHYRVLSRDSVSLDDVDEQKALKVVPVSEYMKEFKITT